MIEGSTKLSGGQEVAKDSLRVAAFGSVDELNSHIGVAISFGLSEKLAEILRVIQNELFHLGSDLSFLEEDKEKYRDTPDRSASRKTAGRGR